MNKKKTKKEKTEENPNMTPIKSHQKACGLTGHVRWFWKLYGCNHQFFLHVITSHERHSGFCKKWKNNNVSCFNKNCYRSIDFNGGWSKLNETLAPHPHFIDRVVLKLFNSLSCWRQQCYHIKCLKEYWIALVYTPLLYQFPIVDST